MDINIIRAYCFTAHDYREFRVDRIESAISAEAPEQISTHGVNHQKIKFRNHG